MARPCGHKDIVVGCRSCYWVQDTGAKGAAYRQLWAEELASAPPKPVPLLPTPSTTPRPTTLTTCIHLGDYTGQHKDCLG